MIWQLGIGLGVLGAFFVGAGAAAILAAIGPAGWLILGFGALAAEFAVFGKSMFDLKSAVSWITFGPFTPLVTSLYDFGNAIAWLWDKVKALFGLGEPRAPATIQAMIRMPFRRATPGLPSAARS